MIASPWVWFHYLGQGERAPTGGVSLQQFSVVAPQMLELLFYIPWYGALLSLAVIGALAAVGARSRSFPSDVLMMLLAWLGLGIIVLLVYAATPGSGNSPRVLIPALPPLALLVAAGITRLPLSWKRRVAFYLITLFTVINLVTTGYYAVEGVRLRRYEPVWRVLREQPRGYVLTEAYWHTILYARQPQPGLNSMKPFNAISWKTPIISRATWLSIRSDTSSCQRMMILSRLLTFGHISSATPGA